MNERKLPLWGWKMKVSTIAVVAIAGLSLPMACLAVKSDRSEFATATNISTVRTSLSSLTSRNHPDPGWQRHARRKNWRDGLRQLAFYARTSPVEVLAVYADSSDLWEIVKSRSDPDRVEVSRGTVIRSIVDLAELTVETSKTTRVCIAHTHAYRTILGFIHDPAKRPKVFDVDRGVRKTGRLSVSPSRADVDSLIDFASVVHIALHEREFTNVEVYGLVVDPTGLYYYRPYRDSREKMREHPELVGTADFTLLDIEEQSRAYSKMSKYFFSAKVRWTTLLNLEDSQLDRLLATRGYRDLKFAYASFTTGTKLRFTDQPDLEPSCAGTEYHVSP